MHNVINKYYDGDSDMKEEFFKDGKRSHWSNSDYNYRFILIIKLHSLFCGMSTQIVLTITL